MASSSSSTSSSSSSSGEDEDSIVVLHLTDPSSLLHCGPPDEEISISTSHIESWDLPLILQSSSIKVRTNRIRLVEQSAYFRALLGGSFSESSLGRVPIKWNVEIVLNMIQFMFGCRQCVRADNFLLLLEGALFFGVESLFSECEVWFRSITCERSLSSQPISWDSIVEIWNFGFEHGVAFLQDLCKDYLARNFAQVVSWCSFAEIPYDLLRSSIEHPQLTVDSEKQLCEALLRWISNNSKSLECASSGSTDDRFDILKKVKIHLLPLGFAAGLRRHFPQFGNEVVSAILTLLTDCPSTLRDAFKEEKLDNFRIRLTEYSEKIILSGCSQVTLLLLFVAVVPFDLEYAIWKKMILGLTGLDWKVDQYRVLQRDVKTMSVEAVHEIDISKCPKVHFSAAIDWLSSAFPSLRILKASHCLQLRMVHLYCLLRRCPLVDEVDLTVDITSLLPTEVSIISTSSERCLHFDGTLCNVMEQNLSLLYNIVKPTFGRPVLSNLSKLTLEGRSDINDLDILKIADLTNSLTYLNIKGCTQLTDAGISSLLRKCLNIHSLVLSYTSFGRSSTLSLCSRDVLGDDFSHIDHDEKYAYTVAFRLQQLHLDGCKGIDESSMSLLLSYACMLKILNVRKTCLTDDAICNFMGSSLRSLDVSETMVSLLALTSLIGRNPNLTCLKATGCRNLTQLRSDESSLTSGKNLLHELRNSCLLEAAAFGWGFSFVQIEELIPIFSKLRDLTLGLGASPGHHVLYSLPTICPLLESVILIFQGISDAIMRNILESLRNLRVLALHCCLGDWSSFNCQINTSMLKILRLEWVTPWMTNEDLTLLTENCSNIVELSMTGCKLLEPSSQEIISSGWPGLSILHLEECGKITQDGISSLFNCKALEDLLLRHNGGGIGRNFIYDAISKLPLLRKVALDICDACEGGFDSPSIVERQFIRTVKISRCKSTRCGFEFETIKSFKPIHKETIVIEGNGKEMLTAIVKERI